MSFIDDIKNRAKKSIKTIILTESEDVRVLEAASKVTKEGFAKVILIGNQDETNKLASDNNIDIAGIQIIDPVTSNKYDEYVERFYELRKAKGITIEDAKKIIKDNMYFGTMMVKSGDADGLVSGACHSTANTLRTCCLTPLNISKAQSSLAGRSSLLQNSSNAHETHVFDMTRAA